MLSFAWLGAARLLIVDFDPNDIIFHYHGQEDDSRLGSKLASLGDVNGDGFDDIAVSSANPRGIYVFFGGNPVDSFPDMFLEGYRTADPIDLDGDGIPDVVTSKIIDPIGTIYFFKGYGDSLASVPYDSLKPETENYNFGSGLATGYIDADEFGDILTSKRITPDGPILYYYSGCPTLDTMADWVWAVEEHLSHTFSDFGFIDFDGDGNQDIYLGLRADLDTLSYVYIFLGPDFGAGPDIIIGHPLDYDPSPVDQEYFAVDVANVGDLDGDGFDELSVEYYDRAFIYKSGPGADTLWDYRLAEPSHVTSAAGDINGDGYGDLLAGGLSMYGTVDVYLGGNGSFDEECDMVISRGDLPPLFLEFVGYSLSPAGDFNGDGYNDFVFACENFAFGAPGDVFVVQGGDYLPTDVTEPPERLLPEAFHLGQNYPNPFNAGTRIEFSLTREDTVTLTVFNILGQRVATLIDGRKCSAGHHVVEWDGRFSDDNYAPSGVYFYKLTTSSHGETRKMVLVK
ncbi:MAG: FG-GAP repeat protein [Candidatus Zixiibacteriota bacterium]|nr:MAG: FG-GAP repeat protein [candidate division Zixibacteria bacterium]